MEKGILVEIKVTPAVDIPNNPTQISFERVVADSPNGTKDGQMRVMELGVSE